MKRRIILFLLNLIGGKKNQETEEETYSRRLGCGCLFAIAFVPFLPILLFIIIIVWVSSSLMSCMAPVVLSDVFGVQITEKDERCSAESIRSRRSATGECRSISKRRSCISMYLSDYTKPLLSIPAHRFLFYPGTIEESEYCDLLQLEECEFKVIRTASKARCLFRCGNERYKFLIQTPEYKMEMFGTEGGR